MNNPKEDLELIERARGGDQEAFSDLVMKHRSKAVNWAKSITHDTYLAEDIAQDALLRSYLHLESLKHSDRFLPWFRNIVRNKAIYALRKNKRNNIYIQESEETHTIETDTPEIVTLHKEWMESITVLLESLPDRNRHIFEAHFFKQHSPEEIAQEFQITTSNVYNIISRSKLKLQEDRFRRETAKYLQHNKRLGQATSLILTTPHYRSAYTSLGHVLYEVIPYIIHGEYSLSEVMGLTGQAFRTQMTVDCGLSGSMIYDWGWVMERAAITFGYHTRCIGRPGKVLTPDTLIQALGMIHQSIERGTPVIVWNLSRSEFGIIYGYNDQSCQFTYRNAVEHSLEVSYEKLGRTMDNPELFVGSIENLGIGNQPQHLLIVHALKTIVDHARGIEPSIQGYIKGIAAYETWIEAFETNQVHPVGHAYHVTLLTEAREHAVTFLEKWEDHPIIQGDSEIASLWREVIHHYQTVHRSFVQMYPSYPYGMPGVQIDISEQSIRLLKQAKEAEVKGINLLEKIYWRLTRHS